MARTSADGSLPEGSRFCSFVAVTVLILIYFCFSIGLTFYQRWFIKDFHYPLLVGLCHMSLKWVVSIVIRFICACWARRRNTVLVCRDIVRSTVPVGLASGIDIAFSNWAFEFITISLYTTTKSTSIIFLVMFALLFRLEKKSWSMFGIVSMIGGGLAMFTYKSTQFNIIGFLMVLFASLCSGLRWTLCQFVMQKSDLGLDHPIDMMYHLQPWMFLSILPFFIGFEGEKVFTGLYHVTNWTSVAYKGFLICVGGCLAVCLELTEYKVVSSLSSLTLSIAAVFKEVVTLALAVVINGDQISLINGIGLLLCLGGIVLHVVAKANYPAAHVPLVKNRELDDATARFLHDDVTSSEEQESNDEDSEVLFSVLNSRERR